MSNPGLWIQDPDTGEERFIFYSELEGDTIQSFVHPIGGFVFPANLFTLSRLPSVPFYIRDWLPKQGKAMLYGPAKTGKSYLCAQLARCIASGEDFLGQSTTTGRVLYVQFELGEEIFQSRLRSTGQDYDNVFVGTSFSMKLDTKVGRDQLWRALEAVEPSVLILDPKIKMISGDENESTDMRQVTDFLDLVIEGFRCSVFVTDHTGKDASKRGRGSSVWEGWVDSYLSMKKVSKKGEGLKIKIEPIFLRHAQLPPEPIEAELGDDFEFHLVGSAPTVKQQVLDFLEKKWAEKSLPCSPGLLFEAKIGSNTSVYQALAKLVEEEKVEKVGWGKYSLVKGR